MRRRALPILLALVCVTGCVSLAPTYQRPAPPVPAEWPSGPAYQPATDGSAMPVTRIAWRDFYTDERLRNVIELALANNRDLRVAAANVQKAQAFYRIQRAQLFPEIDASGGTTREKVPSDLSQTGRGMTVKQYYVDLGTTAWELDFFGRINSLKDRALQQYLSTEEALRSARIALTAEVANAYLTRAADVESLKLAQSTLAARETTYKLTQRRFEVGASSALDVRQAQTVMESARVEVYRFTRFVALDENALNLLVGAQVPTELLADELSAVTPTKDISAGLSSEVLLNRPDILQAEDLLKGANASIGAARAAFFPRITLTSSIGTINPELSGLFTAGGATWLFAPQINLPIFDAGSRWAGLDAAKADRDMYLAQYEKAIQVAFREVADALAQRGTVGDQMAAQEAVVRASEDALMLSMARYTKGIDSYLPVLDSQRSLYVSQQALILTHLARLTNLVTLYKVLGGGSGEVPLEEAGKGRP